MGNAAESLNRRLRNAADEARVPAIRLRNRLAYQRILARLARHDDWVLKGGFSLELRLGLTARATKDLDVLRVGGPPLTALDLQDTMDEALDVDLDDGFTFRVRPPRPARAEDAEPSTWRMIIEVRYAGAEFGTTTVDVVVTSRPAETEIDLVTIETMLVGKPFTIAALDVHRHAAEKFHAYSRLYARDRPSSRVKDLVDLVLLAESGTLCPPRLGRSIQVVFQERGDRAPRALPEPPRDWTNPFDKLADETQVATTTLDGAWHLAAELYRRALTAPHSSGSDDAIRAAP